MKKFYKTAWFWLTLHNGYDNNRKRPSLFFSFNWVLFTKSLLIDISLQHELTVIKVFCKAKRFSVAASGFISAGILFCVRWLVGRWGWKNYLTGFNHTLCLTTCIRFPWLFVLQRGNNNRYKVLSKYIIMLQQVENLHLNHYTHTKNSSYISSLTRKMSN